ncbi:hypothetical protein JCM11641_000162 [Rhodosporidiobolus odoratus]
MPPQQQPIMPIQQLNPQQLAALQEHIRVTRNQTGQEVTPAMIGDWMARNGIATNQQAPMQPQQQAQQVPQQAQADADRILQHLYPPQLAANPQAALTHLHNVLFPANQTGQSPLLQRVMQLAQAQRLSQEQMSQLKQAVAMKNQPQVQQQQQQPQQFQQQGLSQGQLQGVPMQQPQHLPQQAVPPSATPGPQVSEQSANQAVAQLRVRVQNIEKLLSRDDISQEQRAKMQNELELARTNLSRVIKMLLAAQQQQQAQQAQAQVAAATGTVPGQPVNTASLQEAQRQALERRAREIQARQQAAAQAQIVQQQANGQFRTASPSTGFPGQPGGLPPTGARGSPALAGAQLPGGVDTGVLPNLEAQKKAAAAAAAAVAAATGGKKLTKKQQAEVHAMSQQQAAQQANAQAQALAQAQAMAQAQAQAQVDQQQGQGGQGKGPAAAGPAGGAGGGAVGLPAAAIAGTLNVSAPSAESFPPHRPTISGGMANNPSISTPAITKSALGGLLPGFGLSGGGVGDAFGTPGSGSTKEAIPNKDARGDDSKGRTVSKRKIRELVEAVDPEERLSDEVEDLLLEICDEFIDSVTRFGCQLAKHRKSDRLEVKDLALHLERSYNIRVPGFAPDETRQSGAKRVQLPPGHAARLTAIREGGRRR